VAFCTHGAVSIAVEGTPEEEEQSIEQYYNSTSRFVDNTYDRYLVEPRQIDASILLSNDKGEQQPLEKFLGGELTLIKLWATWCASCIQDMQDFSAFKKSLGKAPVVEVLAISEDFKGFEAVKEFYEDHTINNLSILVDKANNMTRTLGISGMPVILVIDDAGNEIARMNGHVKWHDPKLKEWLLSLAKKAER
jgi:thiol-disulfide isomerase/thioredoxin